MTEQDLIAALHDAFASRHDGDSDVRSGSRQAVDWCVAALRIVRGSHRAPSGPFRAQVIRIMQLAMEG